jgi:5-methylcytosine-specific restriction endonuclease McrA
MLRLPRVVRLRIHNPHRLRPHSVARPMGRHAALGLATASGAMSKTPRNTAQRERDRARIKATRASCHICGEAIDYSITDPLSPRAFVVDHIIPLAKGGTDTLGNKAAAHRTCNSTKRARLVAPIVRRSGVLG